MVSFSSLYPKGGKQLQMEFRCAISHYEKTSVKFTTFEKFDLTYHYQNSTASSFFYFYFWICNPIPEALDIFSFLFRSVTGYSSPQNKLSSSFILLLLLHSSSSSPSPSSCWVVYPLSWSSWICLQFDRWECIPSETLCVYPPALVTWILETILLNSWLSSDYFG